MSQVSGIGELEEGHHVLLIFYGTLLLRVHFLKFELEVGASLVDLLKDEDSLVFREVTTFTIKWLRVGSTLLDEDWCCHVLHDSLNQVELLRLLLN